MTLWKTNNVFIDVLQKGSVLYPTHSTGSVLYPTHQTGSVLYPIHQTVPYHTPSPPVGFLLLAFQYPNHQSCSTRFTFPPFFCFRPPILLSGLSLPPLLFLVQLNKTLILNKKNSVSFHLTIHIHLRPSHIHQPCSTRFPLPTFLYSLLPSTSVVQLHLRFFPHCVFVSYPKLKIFQCVCLSSTYFVKPDLLSFHLTVLQSNRLAQSVRHSFRPFIFLPFIHQFRSHSI